MAKSRVKGGGCTRDRLKLKMLGKGSSTKNRRVKKKTRRLVHVKFPSWV